jgi:DNA primase large subunit
MKKALEDNVQLIGSEGHCLRLAIVVKARAIGMDDEEITLLFQNLDNYDYDISHEKVVETRKFNYLPWSCDTLRDKCGTLIVCFCEGCLLMHKIYT